MMVLAASTELTHHTDSSAAYSVSFSNTFQADVVMISVLHIASGSITHYLFQLSDGILQRASEGSSSSLVGTSIAHISVPIGSPIDCANGSRIPLSIVLLGASPAGGAAAAVLVGPYVLYTAALAVVDLCGDDDSGDAVAADSAVTSLSPDSRYFLLQAPPSSPSSSSSVLSFGSCLFVDSRYANSDIAHALIAKFVGSPAYLGLLESLLGLMMVTEGAIGSADVIASLLGCCSFGSPLLGKIGRSRLRAQVQSVIESAGALLRGFDASALLFEALHAVFEDLRLDASRGAAAIHLCCALRGVVRVVDGAGAAYFSYYSAYLLRVGFRVDDADSNERAVVTGISPAVCAIPNSTTWLCQCLEVINSLYASNFETPQDLPSNPFGALLPAVFDGGRYSNGPPLATVRLCHNFFAALKAGCGKSYVCSAQRVVDAFTTATAAALTSEVCSLPVPIRYILEMALSQCRHCPIR